MSRHPVEALLRPPVELMAGTVALACAWLAVAGPELFLLTPTVGTGAALLLAGCGLWWCARGYRVVAYQRNLRRLPRFALAPEKIPVSRRQLYLGRGFRWLEKHTQRLHDTRRGRFARYVDPGTLFRAARRFERARPDSWLARVTGLDSLLNPVRPLPPVGGTPHLHGVEPKEHDVFLPLTDRTGHLLVLGTTQVGKTRALEVMATQDIARGEVVIVIDPKGDADLLRSVFDACERAGRSDDFLLFHLGYPEISARYNAVGQFHRVTEVATRLSGQLSGEGQSAAFKEFAWRFTNIVARALVAMGKRPDYRSILRGVSHIDELFCDYATSIFAEDEGAVARLAELEASTSEHRQPRHLQGRSRRLLALEQLVVEREIADEVLEGLRSAFKYERSYFDKIVASLLPLLEKLTTGKTAALLSPDYLDLDDPRPIFDWRQVVNQKRVVYVGLDALSDTAVASAVGNSLFADLVSYAGERYKHGDSHGLREGADDPQHPIVVHADEFNELMGDEFIPLINKGGAAGLQITAYSQTLSDIRARIGSDAKAKQVLGNFNHLLTFRVREVETARLLTDQLPEVNVHELTLISGYTDSSDPDTDIDFTSRHEDRITSTRTTLLEAHDVMRLPKGQAFALIQGGALYKLRLPLPKKSKRQRYAKAFAEITRNMAARYRTGRNWWLTEPEGAGGHPG